MATTGRPAEAGDPWREFGEIFDAFYSWASPRNKPLMVGEFGVQEGSAGRKGNWFRKVPSTLQNEYPDIKAIVYFDSGQPLPVVDGHVVVVGRRVQGHGARSLPQRRVDLPERF